MRSGHLHPLKLVTGEARAAQPSASASSRTVQRCGSKGAKSRLSKRRRAAFARSRSCSVVRRTTRFIVAASRAWFCRGKLHHRDGTSGDDLAAEINARDLAVCDSNIVSITTGSRRQAQCCSAAGNTRTVIPRISAASMRPRMVELFRSFAISATSLRGAGVSTSCSIARRSSGGSSRTLLSRGLLRHGVNTTHIAAEIVADAIQGTFERFDVFDKLSHYRLPVGQWLGNQALALGIALLSHEGSALGSGRCCLCFGAPMV